MTSDLKEVIANCYGVISNNITFCHLCLFFDDYSKENRLDQTVAPFFISFASGELYRLIVDKVKPALELIHNSPDHLSPFAKMGVLYSLREITSVFVESFRKKEFEDAFLKHIFKGNADKTQSFIGIVRFVRNTLSHNIVPDPTISINGFEKQKKYWLNKVDKHKMEFNFSYKDQDSPFEQIKKRDYPETLDICIDWDTLNDGEKLFNLIKQYQLFLLMEFCSNALNFLDLHETQ